MKKRILCLAMAAMMVLGVSMTANAADAPYKKSWGATYDGGKEIKMTYDDTGFNLLPGDTMEIRVALENTSSKKVDFYMKNEIIDTLEDNGYAAEGAYTYILTYADVDGSVNEIYNSDRVGGDEEQLARAEEKIGLEEIEINKENQYIYLDRLNSGEKAYLTLSMTLDGETQGNGYQISNAELMLQFAAEVVDENTIVNVDKVERFETVVVERPLVVSVKTGDSAPILIFSAAALCSAVVLIVAAARKSKKRDQKGV